MNTLYTAEQLADMSNGYYHFQKDQFTAKVWDMVFVGWEAAGSSTEEAIQRANDQEKLAGSVWDKQGGR